MNNATHVFQPAECLPIVDRQSRARAFRAARRHSGLVRVLRAAMPALAVAVAAAVGISGYLGRPISIGPISIGGLSLTPEGLRIDSPRLSGFDKQDRAYEVSAREAVQNLKMPDLVKLDRIDARLGAGGADWTRVNAQRGIYDGGRQRMTLDKGIRVESSKGYTATLDGAYVDFDSGVISSSSPSEVQLDANRLTANHMIVRDKGNTIELKNGVSMTLVPVGSSHQVSAAAGDGMTASPRPGGPIAAGAPATLGPPAPTPLPRPRPAL